MPFCHRHWICNRWWSLALEKNIFFSSFYCRLMISPSNESNGGRGTGKSEKKNNKKTFIWMTARTLFFQAGVCCREKVLLSFLLPAYEGLAGEWNRRNRLGISVLSCGSMWLQDAGLSPLPAFLPPNTITGHTHRAKGGSLLIRAPDEWIRDWLRIRHFHMKWESVMSGSFSHRRPHHCGCTTEQDEHDSPPRRGKHL